MIELLDSLDLSHSLQTRSIIYFVISQCLILQMCAVIFMWHLRCKVFAFKQDPGFESLGVHCARFCNWGSKLDKSNNKGVKSGLFPILFKPNVDQHCFAKSQVTSRYSLVSTASEAQLTQL